MARLRALAARFVGLGRTEQRVAVFEAAVQRFERSRVALDAKLDAIAATGHIEREHLSEEVAALATAHTAIVAEHAVHVADGDALRRRLDATDAAVVATRAEQQDAAGQADMWRRISMATAWAQSAPVDADTLVSIVLASRDRAGLLERAIDSVTGQTHSRWELIVVDDASTDDTGAILAARAAADHRIRPVTGPGRGAGAARNTGLSAATGELVAFLDDDNLMAPGWLRAAVEYLARVEHAEMVYGVQLRRWEPGEDNDSIHTLFVDPFDRARLLEGNYVDLGTVVIRRCAYPDLRFDETLPALIDWEMLARASDGHRVDALPVVASLYTVDATQRISNHPDKDQVYLQLRQRFASGPQPGDPASTQASGSVARP